MLSSGHAFARRWKANEKECVEGPRTPGESGALAELRSCCRAVLEQWRWRWRVKPYLINQVLKRRG